jgi:hypothetical protein
VSKRHKVFISYYHDEDQEYANKLRSFYGKSKAIIDKSMYTDLSRLQDETILKKIRQDHLRDSTVTVVLVGENTWGRKWVDWEINSSLRPYGDRTRSGLVGIYLPNHRKKHFRLTDNINSGYAVRLRWDEVEEKFIDAVHDAYNKRNRPKLIDNTRNLRERNAPIGMDQGSIPIPSRQGAQQVDRRTAPQSGCFIATAVYQDPLSPELSILRAWRNEHLVPFRIGHFIISIYYRISPSIACSISKRPRLRRGVRAVLDGLIKMIRPL